MKLHITLASVLLTGVLAVAGGCDRGKSDGEPEGTPVSADAMKAVGRYSAKSGSSEWQLELKENGTVDMTAVIPESDGRTVESSASGTWSMTGQAVSVNLTQAASEDDDIPADDRAQSLTLSTDSRTLTGAKRKYVRQ
ncbi:MAG: hypothetical protein ACAI43_13705 [Phycisphaerae bacterium]